MSDHQHDPNANELWTYFQAVIHLVKVTDRHAAGGLAITERHMERYRGIFQPPTDDELALYDPPLEESN